ncbi:MAG: tetratricopeptide repeat protein [Planctomycetota bacterium]|nr:tetratricopeptide repeat protein [Planctomycetota bacterium]MEE2939167.1 tetratricopeptide repeat protein [Planctomycetota bacterium]
MANTVEDVAPSARRGPRASKATRWRAGVLILVHLLVAIHIGHWLSTGSTVSPFEPSESMDFAKNSIVNTGLVFFAVTIASTLLLGRWFCGWACHLVALQDLSRALLIKIGLRPRPLRSRWMGLVPMIAAGYMFFWPLIYRVWIGDSLAVRGTHFVSDGEEFWSTFTTSWLMAGGTFLVCGFVVVYFLGAKGFCTYACPYGGVFGVVDRVSPGRIRVTDACVQCGHCTLSCTSNVDVSREVHDYGMVVDPGCMKCMDCVSVCPENALHFGFGKPAVLAKAVREKRRPAKRLPRVEEAVGLSSFAFAYLAYRGYRQEKDFLLSLGLAALFAFASVLLVRLVRRSDVAVPGFSLKRGGRLRPVAWLFAGGTLVLGAFAVPYGVLPAVALVRADSAWRTLDEARSRTEATGSVEGMSAEERAAAATLLSSAILVHERSQPLTQVNTERVVWGSILARDPEPLAAVLEDVLASERASAEFKFDASQVFLQIGRPEMAEDAARRVLDEFPGHGRSVGFLVQALGSRGQIDEAEALVREAISARPDDPIVLFAQATLRSARGDVSGAVEDLQRVVAINPLNGEARDQLWRMLNTLRRSDEAVAVLRAGLELEGAPPEWRAHLAQVLLLAGKRDEALVEARALAAGDQDDPRMLQVATAILRQLGETAEADAVARRAAALGDASSMKR